ncbi:General alpha-glucoside permease [Fusarium oxysporum f. sp. albedinis]|nr:General alpha-glucoside permease [Fusarium oxysporum f. sp. albedinis]
MEACIACSHVPRPAIGSLDRATIAQQPSTRQPEKEKRCVTSVTLGYSRYETYRIDVSVSLTCCGCGCFTRELPRQHLMHFNLEISLAYPVSYSSRRELGNEGENQGTRCVDFNQQNHAKHKNSGRQDVQSRTCTTGQFLAEQADEKIKNASFILARLVPVVLSYQALIQRTSQGSVRHVATFEGFAWGNLLYGPII